MESEPKVERTEILRLVGVYAADGSLRGEMAYWFGTRLGRRHCALCDITHGSVRERKDWRHVRGAMGVTFDTVHRDEASADVMAVPGVCFSFPMTPGGGDASDRSDRSATSARSRIP